ncbi:MAG: 2-hydroxyacid dehydrogenase [Gemmatimonadaceae bacterium]
MTNGSVFVTRLIPQEGLDVLRQAGITVRIGEIREGVGVARHILMEGVHAADVLLALLTETVDEEVLAANPRLRGVANYAVGFNNVAVDAATRLGIPVSNTPGVLTDTTADLTWGLILASARRIPQAHNFTMAGRFQRWGPSLFLGDDVSPGGSGRRKVLGIVGFGEIGQAVARRAQGFDMTVRAYDPYARDAIAAADGVQWAELPDLLADSDFVTIHTPLTSETYHLIDEAALHRMKRTAHLINTSRGPVVDERALVRALDERRLAGAGLDVYEFEPDIAPDLFKMPNLVILPHIASASHETRARMAVMAAHNAVAHLRGEPAPNIVNAAVYDSAAYRARLA